MGISIEVSELAMAESEKPENLSKSDLELQYLPSQRVSLALKKSMAGRPYHLRLSFVKVNK